MAKGLSPTARSLAQLRSEGWTAQVVERWNPHAKVRVDFFGVIDILACRPGETIGVQACAGSSHSSRVAKVAAEPRTRVWLEAGNRLEVWSWRKAGAKGERKLWAVRRTEVTLEQLASASDIWSGTRRNSTKRLRG